MAYSVIYGDTAFVPINGNSPIPILYNDHKPWSVERAWGPVLSKSFVPIATAFLENYASLQPPISTGEAMFIIQLMRHKWNEDAPYPSYRRIASRMGVGEKAARRHAASLEAKGYLVRERRQSQTNLFRLEALFIALEKRVEEKVKAASGPQGGR